ncbi:hypothetical protein [Microvirga arabica]|uniref:hypothetical protein n=1 Tax=Microvirga arabica TaxID=1128671 RepID=UPI00193A515A|nr:hypothetical protein [Microvirga arabica]MBM1170027.1 hypothetical protein [Microvirga arabica]
MALEACSRLRTYRGRPGTCIWAGWNGIDSNDDGAPSLDIGSADVVRGGFLHATLRLEL